MNFIHCLSLCCISRIEKRFYYERILVVLVSYVFTIWLFGSIDMLSNHPLALCNYLSLHINKIRYMKFLVVVWYRTSSINQTSMLKGFQGCVHILAHISITCARLAVTIDTKNDRLCCLILEILLDWISQLRSVSRFSFFCWIIFWKLMQWFNGTFVFKLNFFSFNIFKFGIQLNFKRKFLNSWTYLVHHLCWRDRLCNWLTNLMHSWNWSFMSFRRIFIINLFRWFRWLCIWSHQKYLLPIFNVLLLN